MEIKGDRRGLRLLAYGFDNPMRLVEDLAETLKTHQEFLGTASLTVEVEGLPLTSTLFQHIAEVFEQYPSLTLRGIQEAEQRASLINIESRTAVSTPPPKIIRSTVRSGQHVTHRGDLIIIGDVNPGATIVAGGDVMVFGWLRGAVQAGQPDDLTRTISSLKFQPTQIRIGAIIALGDAAGDGPEIARVEDQQIVVDSWTDIHLPDVVVDASHKYGWMDKIAHLGSSS